MGGNAKQLLVPFSFKKNTISNSYGKYGAFKQFGSLASIEQSAQELATFAEDVMARLKVSQVDLVGKSKCWKTSNRNGPFCER